ncbi:MAG: CHAT domain-containing protein, partial [Bacteroidia bacterium]
MRRLRHIFYLIAIFVTLPAGGNAIAVQESPERLRMLVEELRASFDKGIEPEQTVILVEQIDEILSDISISDTLLLSDAHFYTGVSLLNRSRYHQALERLSASARLREALNVFDIRYAYCLSNMSIAWFKVGDYPQALDIGVRAMTAKREAAGEDSVSLVSNYLNLSSIYLELNEPTKAIKTAEKGLEISRNNNGGVSASTIADLYQVISLSLLRTSEFINALSYARQALVLYDLESYPGESKFLMLNTISQMYIRLGQPEEAEKYIVRGIRQINKDNLSDNYLLYINYAGFLAENGRTEEGEKVLQEGLKNVREAFGDGSREYIFMLASNGSFVNKATGNGPRALEIYRECFPYIESHPWDASLKRSLLTDYALVLIDEGRNLEALETLDDVLGADAEIEGPSQPMVNELYEAGSSQITLEALSLKYTALNVLARETGNNGYIIQAIETGKDLISLYDRFRMGMSEEESRNYLSADAREYYTGIIENYHSLYKNNHDPSLLEAAFEYSERSKVAGFLASIREVNATRFSIPADLALLDTDILKRIGLYREIISTEKEKAHPDSLKIVTWERISFGLLRSRDSLINIFEERYPAYYALKYKTEITPLDRVKKVIGREANLLSYVLTDTELFIFVVNGRHTKVIATNVDSLFYSRLGRFREILSVLPEKTSVREPFNEYMDLAYELYRVLLEPAVPYLKGDKIVISPDNILSYLPFETLVTGKYRSDEVLYRDAPFALKKYRFSYIYSVTLSAETQKRSRRFVNDLVAFAPSYEDMVISDSLLMLYPNLRGGITNLPYAIDEARDALKQCGGRAFVESTATEEAYKLNAPYFDIIHLAMHTLVDDLHPAYSKMIFAGSDNGADDGFLNTYEVYSIPLDAMMVVLSSCNTGSGVLMT